MAKFNYDEKAQELSQAIDVAMEAVIQFPPKYYAQSNVEHFIKVYQEFKNDALYPEAVYRNAKSFSHIVTAVLTFFQEGSGEAVNHFWKGVKEQGLEFKRVNKMGKILKRKRIINEKEFDFVTDVIVAYQQEGLINKEEAIALDQMLGDFQNKKSKMR